jgi:hypothetical protein
MITISGTNWFTRSRRRLPSTRDVYEPIGHHLGGAAGIVKYGTAVGRRIHIRCRIEFLSDSEHL